MVYGSAVGYCIRSEPPFLGMAVHFVPQCRPSTPLRLSSPGASPSTRPRPIPHQAEHRVSRTEVATVHVHVARHSRPGRSRRSTPRPTTRRCWVSGLPSDGFCGLEVVQISPWRLLAESARHVSRPERADDCSLALPSPLQPSEGQRHVEPAARLAVEAVAKEMFGPLKAVGDRPVGEVEPASGLAAVLASIEEDLEGSR